MSSWNLNPSTHSQRTINPIREAVSSIRLPTNFPKPTYSLALGDPSAYADFEAYDFAVSAISEALLSGKGNGYTDSMGFPAARQALAQEFSYENIKLRPEDVILDNGGSGAIHTILQVFLNPGDNLLMPCPGFPLYKTIALNMSAEAITYRLREEAAWEIDLEDLERKVNERTKILIIVNPSNPCGSVYSKEHLLEVLEWAERHQICVLSDEVYHNMTFGKPFHPLGSLTDRVPVFTVGALSKMYLAPGWRCGWALVYDKYNMCAAFRDALNKVKNMLLHPPPFIMQAIPKILSNRPPNYFEEVMQKVKLRSELVQQKVKEIDCLRIVSSEGALYCMVLIDFARLDIKDSIKFAEMLAAEQGVFVLPAEAFLSVCGFRVTLCHPLAILEESMERIKAFIQNHSIRDA